MGKSAPQREVYMRKRRAFTLVELLVVIGIIAVLIGILLPVLSRAQRQTRVTVCLSNQRQLIMALFMYAQENKGVFPGGSGFAYWEGVLGFRYKLADWDTKDRRDVARGSNTAIFEHRAGRWRREARYLITDWGGSMGRWGGNVVTRGRWDPQGFAAQTPDFVTGTDGDAVRFGYVGQRTADVAAGISVGDVRWLCRCLGRITDAQLRDALLASGATQQDSEVFAEAIRERINQLIRVSEPREAVA